MLYYLKSFFKKKIKKDALDEAFEAGAITEEERYRIMADRADRKLQEFLDKKKGK